MNVFQLDFRKMTAADIPEVMEIEYLSYRDCWTEDDMHAMLNDWRVRAFVFCEVESGDVLGFAMTTEDGVHGRIVDRLAVHPASRRRALGFYMLWRLQTLVPDNLPLFVNTTDSWEGEYEAFLEHQLFERSAYSNTLWRRRQIEEAEL